jgi:hypothetical protein
MKRTYVMSTDIKSIGYDESSRILEIEFLNSSIHQYQNVPKIAHLALMTAQAKGLHYLTEIKNIYPCINLTDPVE